MTDTYSTNWNVATIDGREWLVIDGFKIRVPLDFDPNSAIFLAVAAPNGGVGNFQALIKGDPGDPALLDEDMVLTMLDPGDPTADSGQFVLLGGNTYQAHVTLHRGAKGDPGSTELDLTSFGTPLAGRMLVVNSTADGVVFSSQLVGDRFVPSAMISTPGGNPNWTLAPVSIPAQPFDWRPVVSGWATVTGTGGKDVTVDLIARLNNETSGNEVGRAPGYHGPNASIQALQAGPPPGSVDSYDKVSAGAAAVVYLRAERQSGTDTFTTTGATSRFGVRVAPVPGTGVGL